MRLSTSTAILHHHFDYALTLTDIPAVPFAVEDLMSLLSATAPPFMEIVPGNVTFCDESYVYI